MTRVLVCRLDNAGDVLLAGPAVRALASQASVTMVVGPSGVEAARLLPGVDRIVRFEAPWIGFSPVSVEPCAVAALIGTIRAERPDAALVLTSFHQSPLPMALLLRLADVPWIGATCVDHPGSLLDLRHPFLPDVHEADQQLALAAAAGFPLPDGDDGELAVREAALPTAPGLGVPVPDGRYVVVHAGASVPARGLPASLVADAVPSIVASGRPVVLTGTDGERPLVEGVTHLDGVTDLMGRLDLPALAAVLRGAAAVVCGNTGPAHLAAAVGTPVVSVFAPVVPVRRWGPRGVPHRVLGAQGIGCSGCRARRCDLPGQPCVGDLTAADVLHALDSLAAAVVG